MRQRNGWDLIETTVDQVHIAIFQQSIIDMRERTEELEEQINVVIKDFEQRNITTDANHTLGLHNKTGPVLNKSLDVFCFTTIFVKAERDRLAGLAGDAVDATFYDTQELLTTIERLIAQTDANFRRMDEYRQQFLRDMEEQV